MGSHLVVPNVLTRTTFRAPCVADQLADDCRTSTDGGHRGRPRTGEKYQYGFKGARSAPRADGATSPRERVTRLGTG
jgi:hypothetical protein